MKIFLFIFGFAMLVSQNVSYASCLEEGQYSLEDNQDAILTIKSNVEEGFVTLEYRSSSPNRYWNFNLMFNVDGNWHDLSSNLMNGTYRAVCSEGVLLVETKQENPSKPDTFLLINHRWELNNTTLTEYVQAEKYQPRINYVFLKL